MKSIGYYFTELVCGVAFAALMVGLLPMLILGWVTSQERAG